MSSFATFLSNMLTRVSDARDKREGSIIYDTLAPTAAELAQMSILVEIFRDQSYLLTATGINLENRAAESGITRGEATFAIRIAKMLDTNGNPLDLPVGSRFSTPNADGGLNYTLTAHRDAPGECLLTCETAGTAGNAYLGALLPLFVINNLGSATMTGTYIPADDTETDDALRARTVERINQQSFGGNVSAYKEFTKAISGVGDVKVFPVWDGGGTVMLSIVDSEYNVATSEFIEVIQNEIDPVGHSGLGTGIAPVGHRITVTTPTPLSINIAASVSLESGYVIGQLQELVESALSAYLLEIRKQWADAESSSVYAARIVAAMVGIAGINNVTNVTINGSSADLVLTQTPQSQQLPVFSGVVISNA